MDVGNLYKVPHLWFTGKRFILQIMNYELRFYDNNITFLAYHLSHSSVLKILFRQF